MLPNEGEKTDAVTVGRQVTFHRLPTELRLQIWAFLSSPRTVVVRRKFAGKTKYLVSPGPVPLELHICRESRHDALLRGRYVAAFSVDDATYGVPPTLEEFESTLATLGLRFPVPYLTPQARLSISNYFPTPPYIWVNFHLDTIQIRDNALSLVKVEERSRIRKVTVEVKDTFSFLHFEMHNMSEMRNLQELNILSFVDLKSWGKNLSWVTSIFEDWFSDQDEWVCPNVRIIEKATGDEMDSANYVQKAAALSGRGRGHYGRVARGRRDAEPSR